VPPGPVSLTSRACSAKQPSAPLGLPKLVRKLVRVLREHADSLLFAARVHPMTSRPAAGTETCPCPAAQRPCRPAPDGEPRAASGYVRPAPCPPPGKTATQPGSRRGRFTAVRPPPVHAGRRTVSSPAGGLKEDQRRLLEGCGASPGTDGHATGRERSAQRGQCPWKATRSLAAGPSRPGRGTGRRRRTGAASRLGRCGIRTSPTTTWLRPTRQRPPEGSSGV